MIPTIYLFCFSAVFTVYMKYKLAHFLETFDFNWNPRLMLPSIVFSQFVKILPWCHHDFLQWRAAWFYSGNQLNMSTKKLKSWKKLIFAMEHERLNILPVISNVGIMKGLFELIDHWLLLQLLKCYCISSSAPGRKTVNDEASLYSWDVLLHLKPFRLSKAR